MVWTPFQSEAQWLSRQKDELESLPEQPEVAISGTDLNNHLRTISNWKAPGSDQLQGYWIKKIISLHEVLLDSLNYILTYPQNTPVWLTKGATYLIPNANNLSLVVGKCKQWPRAVVMGQIYGGYIQ